MDQGGFGDIWTWILDEDIHSKIFRISKKNQSGFEKVKLLQFIVLPDNDVLVGAQLVDKPCYPFLQNFEIRVDEDFEEVKFVRLSDVEFSYVKSDQE